jgi:hypothetical protein
MTDNATVRQMLALLKEMLALLEAGLDAELEPTPEPEQPARKSSGWDWYTNLQAAIPADASGGRKHFNQGDGWSACGLDFTRCPEGLVGDPRRVWCSRCRNTMLWGNAAIETLSASTSSTSPATATAASTSTSTH